MPNNSGTDVTNAVSPIFSAVSRRRSQRDALRSLRIPT